MASQKPEHHPSHPPATVQKRETAYAASLHVFVIVGFAIAQPLFELLARQAEFFVFRHATWQDSAALVVILCVLLPLGLIGVERIIGLLSHRLRRWVHSAIIAGGVAATVLPALHPIALPGTLLVAGALLCGGVAALAYVFFLPVRQFFSLLSPAVLIFPGLFVFASPAFRSVVPAAPPVPAERVPLPTPPPIVFIILDELPLVSLLNEHQQIDTVRYPNFAALAQHATWFRNTTTVSSETARSVPAILTGKYPDTARRLPHAADHPDNMFTLLARPYELNAFGTLTHLCPAHICPQAGGSAWQRLPALLSDLTVVYLHLLLPRDLRATLPAISQNWMGFVNAQEPSNRHAAQSQFFDRMVRQTLLSKRRSQAWDFIQAIRATDQPRLYYLHLLLPHGPYHYLPSGKVYSQEGSTPGLIGQRYLDDPWGVLRVYYRHLLQVGFVDTWLGELTAHLKQTGLYEQTLLVITSDHGISFRPGDWYRRPVQTTFQDIMPVPLFIKAPFQRTGRIDDRPLETIDILPTLAAMLGVELPWEAEGCSALGPCPERRRRIFTYDGRTVAFDGLAKARERAVQRQHRLFGSETPFPPDPGPTPQLFGHRLEEFGSVHTKVQIEIDRPDRFATVDLQSDFVPAHITGGISPPLNGDSPFSLAVAVNGTIQATTQPWSVPVQGRHGSWSALVPEAAFRAGRNTVEVCVITEAAGRTALACPARVHYRLAQTAVVASDGTTFPIRPHALRGYLEPPRFSEHSVLLKGWAVDEKHGRVAERILIFLNGAFHHAGPTNISRPDIAEWLGQPALATSGFRYTLPAEPFVGGGEVRVFAISGGLASELGYIE